MINRLSSSLARSFPYFDFYLARLYTSNESSQTFARYIWEDRNVIN